MAGPAKPNGKAPGHTRHVALLPAAAIVAWSAVALRLPAIDPRSLWLDDVWVAFLVKHAGFLDLWTYPASVPMGFVAILKPFRWLIHDPEVSLQVFPLLAGLAVVVATGVLVARATALPGLGLLASAVTAVNPLLVTYSARVKHYTTDCLAVVLLLAWGLPAIGDARPARLLRFAAASLVALVVSFVSVFVSAPLLHLPVLGATWEWKKGRRGVPLRALVVVAGFDLCAALFYVLRLRYQTRPALTVFWHKAFMPTDSLSSLVEFFTHQVARAVGGAAPFSVVVLSSLMLIGLGCLVARRSRRLQGLFFLVFFAELLVASWLRVYPLGGGRTDMFIYPVTIVLSCIGIASLADVLTRAVPAVKPLIAAAFVAVAIVTAVRLGTPASYPAVDNARLVRMLERMTKRHDAVVIHWNAMSTMGYYSRWPIEADFSRSRSDKFRARLLRGKSAVAGRGRLPFDPAFLQSAPRALYFETHIFPGVRERRTAIYDTFAAAGFAPVETVERLWARIIVYAPMEP